MKTLLDVLEKGKKKFPTSSALKIKPRYRSIAWNYSQLYNFATGIAKLLEEKGLKKGDRVLLWAPNSPYWLGAFFGCLVKGIIVVPLYLQNRPQFVLNVKKKTEAKLLLKSSEIKKPFKLSLPFINIDYLDNLIKEECSFKKVSINEKDPVQILYTSGTTGEPKGVVLTHKNIVSNLKAIFNIIEVKESDKFLSVLPLSHVFEQIVDFRVLAGGAQIVFSPALSSPIIARTLLENKITKMATVPEFLKLMMNKIEKRVPSFLFRISSSLPKFLQRLIFRKVHKKFGGKLNMIVSGGAPLDIRVGKKWQSLGINIVQGYGLTETSPVVAVTPPPFENIASVGKVVPGVKVKITKDDEILVKGPSVFKKYWKDKKKTKESFTNNWFKTGDLGYFDKEGYLHIKGRKKFMILTAAGQNVYPEDLEFELNKEKGVENSCVVGLKREKIEIHAVLLGKIKKPEKIIARVNKRLASFQQIQSWSIWPFDQFPMTVTKKVKRDKVLSYLTKRVVPEEVKLAQKKAPPLIEILSTVTGINSNLISDQTKIIDLGLDSLMRIELVAQIEEELGKEVDEAKITPQTKVKDLERLIKKGPKRIVRYKMSSWQLHPFVKIIRKVLRRILVFPFLRVISQVKIEGKENLKNVKGPIIFMPNHISHLDSLALLKALPSSFQNNIALAAAGDVLYEQFKWIQLLIILLFNTYPFPRKGQIKSGLIYTGKLVDKGYSILFFPEGRIRPTRKMLPLKKGAGVISAEMKIPVVPVKIQGTSKILPHDSLFPKKRGPILVKFGQPLYFKEGEDPNKVTSTIKKALKNL